LLSCQFIGCPPRKGIEDASSFILQYIKCICCKISQQNKIYIPIYIQKILVFKPDYEVDISGGILYNKIYRFELIISMRLRAWNGGEE
jgi:hypothetical protein